MDHFGCLTNVPFGSPLCYSERKQLRQIFVTMLVNFGMRAKRANTKVVAWSRSLSVASVSGAVGVPGSYLHRGGLRMFIVGRTNVPVFRIVICHPSFAQGHCQPSAAQISMTMIGSGIGRNMV